MIDLALYAADKSPMPRATFLFLRHLVEKPFSFAFVVDKPELYLCYPGKELHNFSGCTLQAGPRCTCHYRLECYRVLLLIIVWTSERSD